MPGPVIGHCGGPNEPACPPQNAFVHLPDGTKVPVKVHKANGRHFFEEILHDIGEAIGESKFGGQ